METERRAAPSWWFVSLLAILMVMWPMAPTLGASLTMDDVNPEVWEVSQKITPNQDVRAFGDSLTVHENRLAITERFENRVFIYEHDGKEWVETAILEGYESLGAGGTNARSPLALHGDVLVGGAGYLSNQGVSGHGGAYIFEMGKDDNWEMVQFLEPPEPRYHYRFGFNTAAGEGLIALQDRTTLYIYERGAEEWEMTAEFHEQDHCPGLGLGFDIQDEMIAARGFFADPRHADRGPLDLNDPAHRHGGAVCIFEKVEGEWERTDLILPPVPDTRGFGFDLDLSEDRIIIGTPSEGRLLGIYSGHGSGIGAVYIYERTHDGWALTAHLESPTPVPRTPVSLGGWGFGSSVALDGDVAFVAELGDTINGFGQVYAYEHVGDNPTTPLGDGEWEFSQRLIQDDASRTDWAGWKVEAVEEKALVSVTRQDAVYEFAQRGILEER